MFSKLKKMIREYSELKYLAYHDSLTGLLNRNWLYKNMGLISSKYVYFFDINNLREVNAKGHTAGDEYIKEVISQIPITNDNFLIRYAGDEFMLFTDKENALTTNKFISVGVCGIQGDILRSIRTADMRMLKAKKQWHKTRL